MKKFQIVIVTVLSFFLSHGVLEDMNLDARIVGGIGIKIEQYPFMAAIVIARMWFQCGCAIISPVWVVTAAHCVELLEEQGVTPSTAFIGAGATNWQKGKMHKIQEWVVHKGYDNETYNNDIALIKVVQPFNGEFEKAIPVPSKRYRYRSGTAVTVIGWGVTKSGAQKPERALRGVNVTIIGQDECFKMYQKNDMPATITNNMFCAGAEEGGRDACQFDSGGPIFDKGHLIGMVSWGDECAVKGKPGVYTRLVRYLNWIRKTAKSLNAPLNFDNVSNAMNLHVFQLMRSNYNSERNSSDMSRSWLLHTIIFIVCTLLVQQM